MRVVVHIWTNIKIRNHKHSYSYKKYMGISNFNLTKQIYKLYGLPSETINTSTFLRRFKITNRIESPNSFPSIYEIVSIITTIKHSPFINTHNSVLAGYIVSLYNYN